MIGNYILLCLLPGLGIAALVFFAGSFLDKKLRKKWLIPISTCGFFLIFLITTAIAAKKVSLPSYLKARLTRSDFIEKNYIDPSDVSLTFPDKKQNLVFLYLESMETTFSDYETGGAFDNNYISELASLALENEDFSGDTELLNGGYAMPGATWTMAGMYATTTGLPLYMPLDDNDMSSQKSFFPNIVTLGDILEKANYRQVLMLGSKAAFGGRELYFTDHGNYEFRDLDYAYETGLIPENYKVFWGYEDEKLFTFARDALTELSSGEQPFNLSLLTVDTHMPKGYQCRLCPDDYPDSPYGTSVACSSKQVAESVHWIEEQPFAEDITIVITGDHPTMAKGFCDGVDPEYIRKTYTCVINPATPNESVNKRRDFTTFDLFPTTLSALGVEIPGHRLGLGTDLFSAEETLSEQVGFSVEAEEMEKNSEFLYQLEKLEDETQKAIDTYRFVDAPGIAVDPENQTIGFETPDISGTGYDITTCRVKVWYYDGQTYVHDWINLRYTEDHTWFGVMNAKKFMDAKEVRYQMYADVKDIGIINLGKEGSIVIHED